MRDGVLRHRDPFHATTPLPPFPGYVTPPSPEPHAGASSASSFPTSAIARPTTIQTPRTAPLFRDRARRRIIRVDTEPGTSLYGTGEVCGPLERRGSCITAWTTDCFGYTHRSRSLYQSHPWVLGVRRDGGTFGVLVETTYRCEIDLRRGIEFRCDGPSPAVLVIERDRPDQVVRTLAELTGFMPMPPKWALGYHQCRWSYEPESKVREIAREFRARNIPCDVIWLDIDYMNGFRCFTFDREKFPDPSRLTSDLRADGFKTVCMIDPGIKVDPGYGVYDQGRAGDHFVRTPTGEEYHGKVWPGDCAFPDFTRAETRRWWADLYRDFMALGIDGVWNDMNEPAVFEGPGKTMPTDNVHRADHDLGGPGTHAKYHNVYGMQMVRATREGVQAARPDRRPFVLTRSNFIGGQRYAATWTGDNTSDWDHLRWSIAMALNLGLSGQSFVGPDIAGFAGNADAELFARWMGIGALLPFARAHSVKDSVPHEPWSFGPECEKTCRLALERRYRLMPYLYTLFHEAATTGMPVVRPVFFADPSNAALRTRDDAFLLGADVLVVADVHRAGPTRTAETSNPLLAWRAFEPLDQTDPALPRLYLRPGAIMPTGPAMPFVDAAPLDPLTLFIAPDASGRAGGTLYEDAGDGHGHLHGEFSRLDFRYDTRTPTGTPGNALTSTLIQGSRAVPVRHVQVRLVL